MSQSLQQNLAFQDLLRQAAVQKQQPAGRQAVVSLFDDTQFIALLASSWPELPADEAVVKAVRLVVESVKMMKSGAFSRILEASLGEP